MRICIFGDSIAYGSFDPEKGGWVSRLKHHCELGREDEIEIYNQSICGDTTKNLLLRLDTEITARQPDMIIFAIGINDSQRAPGGGNLIPFEHFRDNLTEIVSLARKYSYNIIFIGLTSVDENKTLPAYSNSEIGRYDKAIQELCDDKNLAYIFTAGILSITDFEDGLHPNASGHQKLFHLIQDKLGIL